MDDLEESGVTSIGHSNGAPQSRLQIGRFFGNVRYANIVLTGVARRSAMSGGAIRYPFIHFIPVSLQSMLLGRFQ